MVDNDKSDKKDDDSVFERIPDIEEEIEQAKQNYEDRVGGLKNQYLANLTELKKYHAKEILDLKNSQSRTIKDLKHVHELILGRLQENHLKSCNELKEIQNESLQQLCKIHNQTITKMAKAHEGVLKSQSGIDTTKLRAQQESKIKNLQLIYEKTIFDLRKSQEEELLELEKNYTNTINELRMEFINNQKEFTEKQFWRLRSLQKEQQRAEGQFNKPKRKYLIPIILPTGGVVILLILILVIHMPLNLTMHPVNREIQTGFEIVNLKGDTVNTWISWKIVGNDTFHINAISSPELTEERTDMIYNVIFSTAKSEIDGRTYYQGWLGAVQSMGKTKFPIPTHFHSIATDTGTGNIIIKLTNDASADGYSGYTRVIADQVNHQILKAAITIYEVDKLSPEDFKLVVRHELGHGFGLIHSDNPEDLMSERVQRTYPYISQCDLEALTGLYNGSEKSTITCHT